MSSIILKKNMYMKKRFGSFKSIVYRKIQLTYFIQYLQKLLDNFSFFFINKEQKISLAIEVYEYLSRTKDIWWYMKKFSNTVKDKTFEIASEAPELQVYLLNFGYICPYTKRDGNMCSKKLNDESMLCPLHTACKERLKCRVSENLQYIIKQIHPIIFEYLI